MAAAIFWRSGRKGSDALRRGFPDAAGGGLLRLQAGDFFSCGAGNIPEGDCREAAGAQQCRGGRRFPFMHQQRHVVLLPIGADQIKL